MPPIAIRLDANRFGGSDQASQPNRLSDHPTDLPFKFDMSESEDEQSSKNRKVIKTKRMKRNKNRQNSMSIYCSDQELGVIGVSTDDGMTTL